MRLLLPATILLVAAGLTTANRAIGQSGYNYYQRADRVGSPNQMAFSYFKKAYYDHIWNWTRTGSDSAVYYLQLAIKEDSLYGAAYAFLGHVYKFKTYDGADNDEFKNQKWYAEKAIALSPKLGDAYTLMATVKWTEGDKASALSYLRKAVRIEPDHVGNHLWLGMRLSTFPEKKDSAVLCFHRIMKMDPEYGQAYMKLAVLYGDYQVHDSALFYFNKAIHHFETVRPRDLRMINGYLSSAILLKDHFKDYEQAERNLKTYIRELNKTDFMVKDQSLMMAHEALADCYRRMAEEEIHNLITHNDRFLKDYPGDIERTFQVIDSYFALRNDSITRNYAMPLVKHAREIASTPDEKVTSLLLHAYILENTNRIPEAIGQLISHDATYPGDYRVLIECGRLNAKLGDRKKTLKHLNQASKNLKSDGDRTQFKNQLSDKLFDFLKDDPDFKRLLK